MTAPGAECWTIAGRVQGVGYRAWMVRTARALHVAGIVRNQPDGTVLAHVSAPADILEQLYRACLDGPGGADVIAIERAPWLDSDGLPATFAQGATG